MYWSVFLHVITRKLPLWDQLQCLSTNFRKRKWIIWEAEREKKLLNHWSREENLGSYLNSVYISTLLLSMGIRKQSIRTWESNLQVNIYFGVCWLFFGMCKGLEKNYNRHLKHFYGQWTKRVILKATQSDNRYYEEQNEPIYNKTWVEQMKGLGRRATISGWLTALWLWSSAG